MRVSLTGQPGLRACFGMPGSVHKASFPLRSGGNTLISELDFRKYSGYDANRRLTSPRAGNGGRADRAPARVFVRLSGFEATAPDACDSRSELRGPDGGGSG